MIYCTKCGYANEDGTNFCVQCGYNFQNGQSANTIAPKKESSVLKAILCALALVATIFVSMFSAILFIGGTFDGIPSMAVCGFVFLAASIVGAVFSVKGLSKYKATPRNKQVNSVKNTPRNNFGSPNAVISTADNVQNIINTNTDMNLARIIIKDKTYGMYSHDVYLVNKFIGTLKPGKLLEIPVDVGSHMLVFKSKTKLGGEDATFVAVVNQPGEVVVLKAKYKNDDFVISYDDNRPHLATTNIVPSGNNENAASYTGHNSGIRCVRCGSANLFPVSETKTKGKDFKVGDALCGALLLGPLGLICGAMGKGKQTTTTTYWLCKDCGNKFKA